MGLTTSCEVACCDGEGSHKGGSRRGQFLSKEQREWAAMVRKGDLSEIRNHLEENPDSIFFCDDRTGRTAVHEAVLSEDMELLRLLIDYNADLDAQELDSGMTPLHYAAQQQSEAIVEILCFSGANPTIKCIRQMTPDQYTTDHSVLRALGAAQRRRRQRTLRLQASSSLFVGEDPTTGVSEATRAAALSATPPAPTVLARSRSVGTPRSFRSARGSRTPRSTLRRPVLVAGGASGKSTKRSETLRQALAEALAVEVSDYRLGSPLSQAQLVSTFVADSITPELSESRDIAGFPTASAWVTTPPPSSMASKKKRKSERDSEKVRLLRAYDDDGGEKDSDESEAGAGFGSGTVVSHAESGLGLLPAPRGYISEFHSLTGVSVSELTLQWSQMVAQDEKTAEESVWAAVERRLPLLMKESSPPTLDHPETATVPLIQMHTGYSVSASKSESKITEVSLLRPLSSLSMEKGSIDAARRSTISQLPMIRDVSSSTERRGGEGPSTVTIQEERRQVRPLNASSLPIVIVTLASIVLRKRDAKWNRVWECSKAMHTLCTVMAGVIIQDLSLSGDEDNWQCDFKDFVNNGKMWLEVTAFQVVRVEFIIRSKNENNGQNQSSSQLKSKKRRTLGSEAGY